MWVKDLHSAFKRHEDWNPKRIKSTDQIVPYRSYYCCWEIRCYASVSSQHVHSAVRYSSRKLIAVDWITNSIYLLVAIRTKNQCFNFFTITSQTSLKIQKIIICTQFSVFSMYKMLTTEFARYRYIQAQPLPWRAVATASRQLSIC